MDRVNASAEPLAHPSLIKPAVIGTACCVVSALLYTAANICLRKLAALGADEMWVTCMKEVVTVSVIGPWLLVGGVRRRIAWPSMRTLGILVLTGLGVQLIGNLSVQWAFGVVGLAITMPAVFGVMLTAGAVFGVVFLGERVPGRSGAAILLLIVAIILLNLGTAGMGAPVDGAFRPVKVAAGVGAACLAGLMYATLSTVIRSTAAARVPVTVIVFVITGMGVLSLGALSLWRLGAATLVETDSEQLAWMLAAGTFNLIAFLAITKGLHLTTVVHANVLNASQVAMAALAGLAFFADSLNAWSALGIVLTIVGTLLIRGPSKEAEVLETV